MKLIRDLRAEIDRLKNMISPVRKELLTTEEITYFIK